MLPIRQQKTGRPAMNTARLVRHYDSLSPAERLPLIMAASARGDDQEWERLRTSAPRVVYQVTHHFGLAMAFRDLCEIHRMEMLNLAALFLGSYGVAGGWDGNQGTGAGHLDSARALGYLLKVERAGWRLFCEGLKFDPDTCLSCLPGG